MSITTRGQSYLARALTDVGAVAAATKRGDRRRKTYGSLCHGFPVMVRTNGLCQALAFVEAKAKPDAANPSEQQLAFRDLRAHIANVLQAGQNQVLAQVRDASVDEYLHQTRQLLDAWVFYKRFAVSILNVEAGEEDVRQ